MAGIAIIYQLKISSLEKGTRSQNSVKFPQIGARTIVHKHSFFAWNIPGWNDTTDDRIQEIETLFE